MKGITTLLCLLMIGCASAHQARVSLPATHIVQRGETLALIAGRYYGQENRSQGMKAVMKANPKIGRGPGIQEQLVLTIPELNTEADSEQQGGGSSPPAAQPAQPTP